MTIQICTQKGCVYESDEPLHLCPTCNNPQNPDFSDIEIPDDPIGMPIDVMLPDDYDVSTEFVADTHNKKGARVKKF